MQRLPYSFAIFKYCGLWRPINWTGWKSRLYNTYTCIVVVMLIFYYVCNFINIWYSIDNLPEFTNNSFVLLTEFGAFCKALTLLIKRRNIIDLGNILETDICQARDTQEIQIQRSFDQDAKYVINFTMMLLPYKETLFSWKKMAVRKKIFFKSHRYILFLMVSLDLLPSVLDRILPSTVTLGKIDPSINFRPKYQVVPVFERNFSRHIPEVCSIPYRYGTLVI